MTSASSAISRETRKQRRRRGRLDVVGGNAVRRGYLSPFFITNAEKMLAELEDVYLLIHEKKPRVAVPLMRA